MTDLPAVTDEMIDRAWEVVSEAEALPYMARVRNFTTEQILAGDLQRADEEADAMNRAFVRSILEAALTPGAGL